VYLYRRGWSNAWWTELSTGRISSANLHLIWIIVLSDPFEQEPSRVIGCPCLVSAAGLNEWDYVPGMSRILVAQYTARMLCLIPDHGRLQKRNGRCSKRRGSNGYMNWCLVQFILLTLPTNQEVGN
jgi:hypothetical protein